MKRWEKRRGKNAETNATRDGQVVERMMKTRESGRGFWEWCRDGWIFWLGRKMERNAAGTGGGAWYEHDNGRARGEGGAPTSPDNTDGERKTDAQRTWEEGSELTGPLVVLFRAVGIYIRLQEKHQQGDNKTCFPLLLPSRWT